MLLSKMFVAALSLFIIVGGCNQSNSPTNSTVKENTIIGNWYRYTFIDSNGVVVEKYDNNNTTEFIKIEENTITRYYWMFKSILVCQKSIWNYEIIKDTLIVKITPESKSNYNINNDSLILNVNKSKAIYLKYNENVPPANWPDSVIIK